MDRLDTSAAPDLLDAGETREKPVMSMTALRQTLLELRKQARRHDREDLAACLTLAVSLVATHRRD